ncbi:hypothetical protein I8H83_01515 [Candidatus Saccharibacteria bacterium]|nr:hypothetical protein [Candidatus Saccharibacteria bacterium]MBH2007264.1 hypothetical protein [Candidatus Saccharibacteria bacterium]
MTHDTAPKTKIEKSPNYTLRRAIAIGSVAAAGVIGMGVYNASDSPPKTPEHSRYTTNVETLELGQGDVVINAAINGARKIKPELTLEDQQNITEQAQSENLRNNVVQPGYEVTVRYGEYDGKADASGEVGTDFEVEVTPDVIK